MKTFLLTLAAVALFSLTSYAEDGLKFIEIGKTYQITFSGDDREQLMLSSTYTITAHAGGTWYKVEQSGTSPAWMNLNQAARITAVASAK